ncbi:hypothetical protein I9W82_005101 [Candida metapsilosis]|uniref:Exosome complex protein n=1 Tax=Candida metapsilosis TaxID=273372 RepID=A0A8H7ZEZ3_9ASCO|nr:hypothetical protein I9W82_005101 [Candida metapsilosis]
MENLDNIKLYLKSLDQSLSQYEPSLEPLLSRTLDEHLAQQPSPQDKIKFLNNFQYVLISTIYSYLKSIGIDTDAHPIKKELSRVKSYMMRAKNMDSKSNETDTTAADKEKTKEFITRTLGVKNGVENTVSDVGPAISTQNFQGTHTRFTGDDEEEHGSEDESKVVDSLSGEKQRTPIENIKKHKGKKQWSKEKSVQKHKSALSKNRVTKVKHGYLPPKSNKQKKA